MMNNDEQHKPKLLLVDDRPENLFALSELFKSLDVELVKAESGQEALRQILRHDFALILMDVQMPEMDGFETAELIRGNEQTAHIPIIFVTAINKDDKHVFKGYSLGAVDYIFKPICSRILLSKTKVFIELDKQKYLLQNQNKSLLEHTQLLSQCLLINQRLEKTILDEQKSKSIATLAGGIAHNFNNLLQAIQGYIQLAEQKVSDDKVKQYLQKSMAAGDRAKLLVDDLACYSRADSTDYGSFSSHDLFHSLSNLTSASMSRSVDIDYQLSEIQTELIGDKSQIMQVMLNIIDNAADSIEHSGQIEVNTDIINDADEIRKNCPSLSSSEHFCIRIKDHGEGMGKEQCERIFDPFFTTKEPDKGIGLGLSIAYRIIKEHKGGIMVDSKLGVGSCFSIYLPTHSQA